MIGVVLTALSLLILSIYLIVKYSADYNSLDSSPSPKYLSTPIFSPKKHTVSTYRAQQRAAKRRKKNRK